MVYKYCKSYLTQGHYGKLGCPAPSWTGLLFAETACLSFPLGESLLDSISPDNQAGSTLSVSLSLNQRCWW